MKFLAILRDSLREALDTKVFYAMLALSSLVILLVASVSYHPVTVEAEAQRLAGNLTWILGMMGKEFPAGPPHVELSDFEQTNPGAPAWQADYRFALLVRFPDEEGPKRRDKIGFLVSTFVNENFPYLDHRKIRQGTAPDAKTVRFDVTTQGSRIRDASEWPHEPVVLFALPLSFWHEPIGAFVRFVESTLVGFFGAAVALLLSAVITAFFIPNMLRKGTVDLLIVKPIHRTTLLVYKYVGGLTFIFLNTAFVVLGIWLVLGLRTGLWGPGFLISIPVITFQFALYYAVSALFGVLTRSPIVAILASCAAWFFIGLVAGYGYYIVDSTRLSRYAAEAKEKQQQMQELNLEVDHKPPQDLLPDWAYTTADVIHFVTPRVKDLDLLTGKLIAADTLPSYSSERKTIERRFANFSWMEATLVTSIYIVLLLALSCWWFATKDY